MISSDRLLVPSECLRSLLAIGELQGVSRDDFLQRHEIAEIELDASSGKLQFTKYVGATLELLKRIDSPALGIEVAQRLGLSGYGLVSYTISATKHLEQALEVYNCYSPLLGEHRNSRYSRRNNQCQVTIDTGLFDAWPELVHFEAVVECAYWFLVRQRWLVPRNWFKSIRFRFAAQGDEQVYREFFQCPVEFNADINSFVFDAEYLKKPFSGFNESIYRLAREQCEKALHEATTQVGVVADVRQRLALSVSGYPSFEMLAAEMGMSTATLRRHLQKAGTSYKELLKQLRIDAACRFLKETPLPIKEIAYLTGYSEPNNFNRAFHREMGIAPGAYRKRHRVEVE